MLVYETGFKFIGNVALRLVSEGFDVPFGYEEAIGFMVETGIHDKDGVSATVCMFRGYPSCKANRTYFLTHELVTTRSLHLLNS